MLPLTPLQRAVISARAASLSGIASVSGAQHAGAAKNGYPGIGVTTNGGPTFEGTPHLYQVKTGQRNIVRIVMQGSYARDFAEANAIARLGGKTPDEYTWHHLDDYDPKSRDITMELVKTEAHISTFPHNGGVKLYQAHHNISGIYGQERKRL